MGRWVVVPDREIVPNIKISSAVHTTSESREHRETSVVHVLASSDLRYNTYSRQSQVTEAQ